MTRMALTAVKKGRTEKPLRTLLYGVEGVGKSTFGAGAPGAVFLAAEDGLGRLDVASFPEPHSWDEVFDALRELGTGAHSYQTLVIDTLDWLEPLVWRHVVAKAGVASIEDVGGGYGKGYVAALDEWRLYLATLDRLREVKGMQIVQLAHSWIRNFKNPEGDDFDRYEMKLHAKSAGLIKEWSDCVLFANYQTFATKDKRTKRVKGVSTGARMIYTTRTAAYDAKNRQGLPEELPLSWADFEAAVRSGLPSDPAAMISEIIRKAKELGGDVETRALASMEQSKADPAMLAHINDRLNALLGQREEVAQ